LLRQFKRFFKTLEQYQGKYKKYKESRENKNQDLKVQENLVLEFVVEEIKEDLQVEIRNGFKNFLLKVKSAENSYLKLIHKLQKVPNKVKELFPKKKKINGGFMLAKWQDDEKTDYDWICTNREPKDFTTLVRFAVMSKISVNCQLHTRQFVESTGNFILMVTKADQRILEE
jgi:hypothetical protein